MLANAKRVSADFEDEMNGVGGSGGTEEEAEESVQTILNLIGSGKYDDVLRVWKDAQR